MHSVERKSQTRELRLCLAGALRTGAGAAPQGRGSWGRPDLSRGVGGKGAQRRLRELWSRSVSYSGCWWHVCA